MQKELPKRCTRLLQASLLCYRSCPPGHDTFAQRHVLTSSKPRHRSASSLSAPAIQCRPSYRSLRSASGLATVSDNYFSPNPQPRSDEILAKKRAQDIEKAWAEAHRRGKEAGRYVEEAEKILADHTDALLSRNASRTEQARLANARLSLDSEGDDSKVHAESASSLGHFGFRDLVIRVTTLDAQGDIQARNQIVAKNTLCTQNGVQPRDLRKVDSGVTNVIPQILVRREAILVNILHIRILIKQNSVMLFDAMGTHDSQIQEQFLKELSASLKLGYRNSGGMPYEFRALEAALSSIATALEDELRVHMTEVNRLVTRLESHIVAQELHGLLHYSRQLAAFQRRAKSVLSAIDEVLEQDDDLSAMYLSEGAVRPRDADDHQEVEMLLESFSKQVEATVSEADSKVADLHQTQDVIELILDSSRNSLLTLDLQASIATMGLACGAFVAGLFGMNLHSSLETHPNAFWVTTGLAATLVSLVTLGGLRRVSRLRSIGLGQGIFGEYRPVQQKGNLAARRPAGLFGGDSAVGGRKALYYEKMRKAHVKRDRTGSFSQARGG